MAIGVMQAQKIEGEEKAIYYMSKKFRVYETRYTPIEKTCLDLVWVTNKLRHYMLTPMLHVMAPIDLIRYLLQQLVMSSKVARWTVILSEFVLHYIL